ncbi:hypothetical protein KFL_002740110 [Klebsormidium nitens]|uniref:Transcription activator GCR1-like domain-containing protein n=1 Tax=Klebsormidium nitens TaxID=105231 RepID=A0A1Y1I898_KLENI|nr:hypothetical protein KFL_002740110 [Klebsormidium nitens]|eukprot:GAQ86172.1 hypothetical protein KFL_002740110 [Klebsormidium nitens]
MCYKKDIEVIPDRFYGFGFPPASLRHFSGHTQPQGTSGVIRAHFGTPLFRKESPWILRRCISSTPPLLRSARPPPSSACLPLPTSSQRHPRIKYANLPQARAILPAPTLAEQSPSVQSAGESQVNIVNGVDILREIQRLASRVDSVMNEVSQVKQVQYTLESLIRSSAASPGRKTPKTTPKKRQRKKAPPKEPQAQAPPAPPVVAPPPPEPPAEAEESEGLYDWPPVKTVEECWREMYEGLDGRPSLMQLEEQHASGWRRKKGQRQRFCEKKQVCEYVKHLAIENRCSHQAAIQHLANKKESLCKLLLRLRQYKKSAREMEAQQAANTIRSGGAGGPQHMQGMQGGFQNGMVMAMQPGMQLGGQSGMDSGMQPAMPAGMQPGMQAGMMQPGMQDGMQPGMHPGMQPGMQTGMQMVMEPVMQPGVQNGVQNGAVQSGLPSGMEGEMHDGMSTEMQSGRQNGTPSALQEPAQG